MTGNYLLTNPLLRTHDTNPYNNLLAETVVCNTPSPPAFHSPGAPPPPPLLFLHRFVFALKPDISENALPGERNLRRSESLMCLRGKQPFSLAQNQKQPFRLCRDARKWNLASLLRAINQFICRISAKIKLFTSKECGFMRHRLSGCSGWPFVQAVSHEIVSITCPPPA